MGWSPLSTEVHNTSQYSARTRPPAGVVLHHGATTSAQQIIDMEVSGSRQVSSHQVVKDARNAGIVQEQFRAWSLSDSYWDSWAFTVECANESTVGWTISAASHETLAQLVANWGIRYGFWPSRSGAPQTWTVLGHREVYTIWGGSYATACPGGMDLDWIVRRAQEILTPQVITQEQEMALLDGGYIAEVKNNQFIRGMVFGPGVPGGVIVTQASEGIEKLQAMGNIAGVRSFNPENGQGNRIGAPIKTVAALEFDATVALAKTIFGQ